MGIFTLLALCVPLAILVCLFKGAQWIVYKIVDAIEWRHIKKRYSFRRKAWMM